MGGLPHSSLRFFLSTVARMASTHAGIAHQPHGQTTIEYLPLEEVRVNAWVVDGTLYLENLSADSGTLTAMI